MSTITAVSSADFLRALRDIHPIAPHHVRLLRAHYLAPRQTATATELAQAVGYAEYNAVNLHYGKFVLRLCESLQIPHDFSIILASALPDTDAPGHLQLVMAPALVDSLDELCWGWAS